MFLKTCPPLPISTVYRQHLPSAVSPTLDRCPVDVEQQHLQQCALVPLHVCLCTRASALAPLPLCPSALPLHLHVWMANLLVMHKHTIASCLLSQHREVFCSTHRLKAPGSGAMHHAIIIGVRTFPALLGLNARRGMTVSEGVVCVRCNYDWQDQHGSVCCWSGGYQDPFWHCPKLF